MLRYNDANPQLCLEAFDSASNLINKGSLSCVENVNSAWLLLDSLSPEDLPPTLRADWIALSNRASRLADHGCSSADASRVDEAGDIGSIILFLGWMLRHGLSAEFIHDLHAPARMAEATKP